VTARHGTRGHTLTSPLAFPRFLLPRRLDARDRRVEGLVMELMVRAAQETPTRPSLEEPRVCFFCLFTRAKNVVVFSTRRAIRTSRRRLRALTPSPFARARTNTITRTG